jgi:hypothetical protein
VPGEPVPVADATLRQWLRDLDSDEFAERQKASSALAKLGKAAEPALRRALEDNPSTEVRRRVEDLLKKLDPRVDEDVPAGEELRACAAWRCWKASATRKPGGCWRPWRAAPPGPARRRRRGPPSTG